MSPHQDLSPVRCLMASVGSGTARHGQQYKICKGQHALIGRVAYEGVLCDRCAGLPGSGLAGQVAGSDGGPRGCVIGVVAGARRLRCRCVADRGVGWGRGG
jgi:hypothetical protein